MAGGGNMGAAQPGNASAGGGQSGYGGGSLFGQQPQQQYQPMQYQQPQWQQAQTSYQQPQQYQQQYQQPQFQQPFGGPFAYGSGNGYQGGFPGYGGGPQMGYGPMMGGYGRGFFNSGGYGPMMGGYGGGFSLPSNSQNANNGNQYPDNSSQPISGSMPAGMLNGPSGYNPIVSPGGMGGIDPSIYAQALAQQGGRMYGGQVAPMQSPFQSGYGSQQAPVGQRSGGITSLEEK